jgi:predicted acylesterase/phospholipase RssA
MAKAQKVKSETIRKPAYGLALSGGGFRASFFHIGVLARLAELDLLRSVEVISCVSGGSIIGALYYLHLKRLLECKPDADIGAPDYIDIIQTMEKQFLEGVEKNIRTRTFGNLFKNFRMFRKNYSRSDRISELYDQYFYEPVAGKPDIPLAEIKIHPKGHNHDFHPRLNNNDRTAKVPILILNATSMNTGHNWQFTASYMGEPEPPGHLKDIVADIDKNTRLRRLYYHESSIPKIKQIPLRIAVAASAAVPGLFSPLPITELYHDTTVQLADGGVHDNQGIMALLYEGCRNIIVSDASGQLEDQSNPNPTMLSMLGRSNAVLMSSLRKTELESLYVRKKRPPSADDHLAQVILVHLKKDLVQLEKTWIGGTDKDGQRKDAGGSTVYGVDRNVQTLLSRIRTDLDSFSEVESFSLMSSAYKMTKHELSDERVRALYKQLKLNKPGNDESLTPWRFSEVDGFLCREGGDLRFVRQLRVAEQRAFRLLRLAPPWFKGILFFALGIAVILFAYYIFINWDTSLTIPAYSITYGQIIAALIVILTPLVFPPVPWLKIKRNHLREWLVKGGIALLGFIVVWFSLAFIDPLFKRQGRIKKLME